MAIRKEKVNQIKILTILPTFENFQMIGKSRIGTIIIQYQKTLPIKSNVPSDIQSF